jgi:SAM-dependent methyltransferase
MDFSQVNNQFYQDIFKIWNNEPDYYWDGFWYLYPYLDQCFAGIDKPRVLDIGSANGRFFNFLEFCFPDKEFVKVGIDFVDFEMVNDFEFIKCDISKPEFLDLELGQFDLVTAFGVFHHIQSQQVRDNITKKINNLLYIKGLYVFTRWNFLLLNRLRKHILPPTQIPSFDPVNLEVGDYFLKWDKGQYSIRFANFMDIEQIDNMLNQGNLNCIASFDADDKTENRNSYFICKK